MEHSRFIMFPKPAAVTLEPNGFLGFHSLGAVNLQEGRTPRANPKMARPPQLDEFLNLAGKDDQAIVRAAARYGSLFGDKGETVDDWRRFSRLAGCILAAGRSLAEGSPATEEDWQAISEFVGMERPRAVRLRQFYVLRAVDTWLTHAGTCETHPQWVGKSIEMQIKPDNLLSAIGLLLVDAIQEHGGKERCLECGRWFKTKRRLPGKRRFCQKCGRRAAMKYVMRERRARGRGMEGA